MFQILGLIIQKSALLLTASTLGVLMPFFQIQPQLPAMDSINAATTQALQREYLPEVHLSMDAATSSEASSSAKLSLPAVESKAAPASVPAAQPRKTQVVAAPQPKPAPVAAAPVKIYTPQDLLNSTTYFLNQRTDGQYVVALHAGTGGAGLDWRFYDDTIGGTASVPKMNMTYSCDPQWNPAPYNTSDLNPTFDIDTAYTCKITATDHLMHQATKTITFKTGVGRLMVMSTNLSTLLKSGSNSNGFVLDNQSNQKITVTGLTLGIRFKALNTSSPIMVRVSNPDDSTNHVDFNVQNSPADPLDSNARIDSGVKISFSFSINPHSQRLLPIDIFGIQPLMTVGVNPEFRIALDSINLGDPSLKTVLFSPNISWTCIPFDPTKSLTGIPTDLNCK